MRVSLVSHAYAIGANQEKAAALTTYAEMQVVAPSVWKSRNGDPLRRALPVSDAFIFSPCRVTRPGRSTFLFSPSDLSGALRRFDPQVVHVEMEAWTPAAVEVVTRARLSGRKVIGFTWGSQRRNRSVRGIVDRAVLRRLDALIAGNAEASDIARLRGYRGEVPVIPQFGVRSRCAGEVAEAQAKGRLLRTELGLEGTVVGFVGRLVREKGIHDLLGAVRDLPDVSTLVVGAGPELDAVRRTSGSVVAVGPVPHEEVETLLAAMDVLVLPSRTTSWWKEQFGHVIVEAMALGVAVIGSTSGAIPEVIGDAGLLFREGDADELREQLRSLCADESLREACATRGLARVRTTFSHERVARQIAEVYERLAAS